MVYNELTDNLSDNSFEKEYNGKDSDKKKNSTSISKVKYNKFVKKISPSKQNSFLPSSQTCIVKKSNEAQSESQVFLSIIKINTKSSPDNAKYHIETKISRPTKKILRRIENMKTDNIRTEEEGDSRDFRE